MPPLDSEQARWFSENLQPHEKDLRSWLRRRFPALDSIDDVIQEAYLRALTTQESEDLRCPRAFLFRTAKNLSLNHLKSHEVSRKIPYEETAFSDVVSDAEDPRDTIARNQEREIMKAAIQSLPQRCRQIMTLNKVYGLSQKDVAKRLNIAPSTVCDQIAIGVAKCTDYVDKYRKEGMEG